MVPKSLGAAYQKRHVRHDGVKGARQYRARRLTQSLGAASVHSERRLCVIDTHITAKHSTAHPTDKGCVFVTWAITSHARESLCMTSVGHLPKQVRAHWSCDSGEIFAYYIFDCLCGRIGLISILFMLLVCAMLHPYLRVRMIDELLRTLHTNTVEGYPGT